MRPSWMYAVSGFSAYTSSPACTARMQGSVRAWSGVAMMTASSFSLVEHLAIVLVQLPVGFVLLAAFRSRGRGSSRRRPRSCRGAGTWSMSWLQRPPVPISADDDLLVGARRAVAAEHVAGIIVGAANARCWPRPSVSGNRVELIRLIPPWIETLQTSLNSVVTSAYSSGRALSRRRRWCVRAAMIESFCGKPVGLIVKWLG